MENDEADFNNNDNHKSSLTIEQLLAIGPSYGYGEEVKQLEQNYYKDGFVPAAKILSQLSNQLTQSVHSLNTLNEPDKNESIATE